MEQNIDVPTAAVVVVKILRLSAVVNIEVPNDDVQGIKYLFWFCFVLFNFLFV